ncbi:TIGR04283 family arsenosugar biosynthesis glycosyltransferase [Reyranella sp.]|uniref:TIGR04283 family arsenosugar biosynthesis glycosyltransferase n=1 Tax=Reyranella sp. TaxID=1929291 RepID=UPI003BAA9FE4
MTARIDVVVPTLDAAATLPRTLAGLAGAGCGLALDVTVSDGGSSDATADIARRSGARVIVTEPGRGGQLAAGAAAGEAPWLLFLHADTVLGDGWCDAVRQFVDEPDNATRAGHFRLRFDTTDRRARRVERLAAWRSRALGLPYGDQGLLIARAFYRQTGGFRPLPLMEDVDLVRRIGRRRLVALPADAVTSPRRYERDGWTRRPLRNLTCLTLYLAGAPLPVVQRLYGR